MALPVTLNARDEQVEVLARGEAIVHARSATWYALHRFMRNKLAMFGMVLVVALCIFGFGAPVLAPASYSFADLMSANQFPNREHPMGTDTIGHDFLSRVMYGTRTSLIVGFAAVVVAAGIGIPLG